MHNRFRFFLSLAILYALLIFFLSSRSGLDDPLVQQTGLALLLRQFLIFPEYTDKVEHFILYAGFGSLIYLALVHSSNPVIRNYTFMGAIIIGITYGAIDEFHQSFVPGRTASIWDLMADGLGVTMAQTIIFIVDKLYFKTKVFNRELNNGYNKKN